MSEYAIRQTFINHKTGHGWTRVLNRRWKTRMGAEKAADREYRWITMPDGKTAVDESSAEVIEV